MARYVATYVARQEARVHLHLPSIHARLAHKQATYQIPKYNYMTHIEAVILAGFQGQPRLQSSADRCADESHSQCVVSPIQCLTAINFTTIIVIVFFLLILSFLLLLLLLSINFY
jgi:hypothetical protein